MMTERDRIPPLGGTRETEGPLTDDEIADQGILEEIEDFIAGRVTKRLSPDYGNKKKRRKRLVRNLKRRRSYAKPVKGGTGKQSRTRRNRFK